MIAALYVEPHGIYANRPDVDPWSEARDARTYTGPHPVVAHPPCQRWSRLVHLNKHRPGMGIGEDGGCFRAALRAVETWWGVLEHPAESLAFAAHGLARPVAGRWTPTRCGWVCVVDQGRYGHVAPKRTWLYYVGPMPPPDLDWTAHALPPHRSAGGRMGVELQPRKARVHTPPAFADLLLALARQCSTC